jgi:hypothetical protein
MRARVWPAFGFIILLFASTVWTQTGTFTYQGKLTDGTNAANGTYEMQFSVHTAASGGTQIGSTITNNAVSVVNGVFTVNLNFSPAEPFSNGADRFLEIAVRKASDPPGFTTLSPRQQITSSPYSIRTLSASTSDSLSSACVGCVDDAKISSVAGAKVTGFVANAIDAVSVTSVVPISKGGTGSATKNFVDLTTDQLITGVKTFTGLDWGTSRPSGLFGQPVTTVLSTGSLSPGATFAVIPGMSTTINVPSVCASGSTSCVVYISADGSVQTTSGLTSGVSRVDIALQIDGSLTPGGAYKRVIAQNTDGSTQSIENWAFGYTVALTPGNHTIQVVASLQSGSAATVGGNSSSVLQGRLTVINLRQ